MKMAAELLSESFSSVSNSDIPTDVKFLFKDEGEIVGEIRAHKLILCFVSDVFKRGFQGGWKDDGIIEIEDVKKESFQAMLDYIYNKKPDLFIYKLNMLCSLYHRGQVQHR